MRMIRAAYRPARRFRWNHQPIAPPSASTPAVIPADAIHTHVGAPNRPYSAPPAASAGAAHSSHATAADAIADSIG